MGKTADREKYIHNMAGTIMGGNYVYPKNAKELHGWYHGLVSQKLKKFSDQTLGKIAACGISGFEMDTKNTTISEVRDHVPFSLGFDGRSLLLEIAVTVVIGAMMDIIRARARRD
jgi:hypothetical protein